MPPSDQSVPNYTPHYKAPLRVAFVGEAPDEHEVLQRRPFVGPSGGLLADFSTRLGLQFNHCFAGNVCQHRPPDNKFMAFGWGDHRVIAGVKQLAKDLKAFKPHVVLALGGEALHAAIGRPASITDMRGTILRVDPKGPMAGMKVLATFHPSNCLRRDGIYRNRYVIFQDMKKALAYAKGEAPEPPPERYLLEPTTSSVVATLRRLRKQRKLISIDIEGYPGAIACVAIAWSESDAILVLGDLLVLSPQVRDAFGALLGDPDVPKVFQNGLYDTFALAWKPYGFQIRGYAHDTMFAQWELACEFPKGLDYLGSLHTWRPYWKDGLGANDRRELHRYCCRDATGTWEILQVQLAKLKKDPASLKHYQFNISLIPAFLHIELRGMRYDSAKAAGRRHRLREEFWALQAELDEACGNGGDEAIASGLREAVMKKYKEFDPRFLRQEMLKKAYHENFERLSTLLQQEGRTKSERGELHCLLGINRNVESVKFRDYLYKELKFPVQFKGRGPLKRPSVDETALLRLQKKVASPIPKLAWRLRQLATRIQMLGIHADDDGRIRAAYNPVGQETGRVSCYTSPTGSGYNLTTIPEDDRDLFIADDDDHAIAQVDLEGADGWTVAANLASLGAPQMLEDLRAGVRPAKVLCVAREHPEAIRLSSKQALKATADVSKKSTAYFCAKKAQHGSSYLMGPRTCSDSLFLETAGEIDMTMKESSIWQGLFLQRYQIRLWHGATMRSLRANKDSMRVPSGHLRHFTNWPERRLGEALAHEPQANTTYVTNRALHALWYDPENWPGPVGEGRPIVEPLHHVHDALILQFPRRRLAWVKKKVKQWFSGQIMIAGIPIHIPGEGHYGRSWGEQKEGNL